MGNEPVVHQPSFVEQCDLGMGVEIGPLAAVRRCTIGERSRIWRFTNLYGCDIGDECMVGAFVEVQSDVRVGDRTRIQSHAFLCSKVDVGDDVFISHGSKFINDEYPPSGDESAWESTQVRDNATIGTNATLLPVEIGAGALVGAGAVVVEDVPANAIVVGNPAEVIGYRN
jgi:acetyltransferase-like isoleucine patch superfamily enzyme